MRLAGALFWFWERHDDTMEAQAALTKALALAPSLPEPRDAADRHRRLSAHAKAVSGLAATHMNYGDVGATGPILRESVQLARALGEKGWLGFGLSVLAVVEMITGNTQAAEAAAQESLPLARASGDPWALATTLLWLGEYEARAHGDLATSQAELAESVQLYRQMGSTWGTALSLLSWGGVANMAGDTAAARPLLEECLSVFLERHDPRRANMARSELAHLERHEGHVALAQALYRQTIMAWEELGNQGAQAHQLECLAFLAQAVGQAERAARLLGAAEAARAAHNSPMWPDQQPEYDRELAAVRGQLGDAALANAWAAGRSLTLKAAVALAVRIDTPPNAAGAITHALARLAAELSPELTYHNLGHTQADVIPGVARLARLSEMSEENVQLLEVAAAYHDIGFIYVRVEHEQVSVRIATETLPAYGFSPQQIERIAGMILATRLPQSPHLPLEEILADADLDVLGRDDFFERNEALRLEFNTVNTPMDQRQWWSAQIRFLQGHTYFTPAARAQREAAKQRHIVILEQWLRAEGGAAAQVTRPA